MVNTALATYSSDNDQSYSSLSAGAILTQERQNKGISIEKAAKFLCVRQTYLQAIEKQEVDKLPEIVYTLGFVRSYARYLALPEQFIVDRFKQEVLKIEEPENLSLTPAVMEQSVPSRKWIGICSLLLMAFFYFIYHHYFVSVTPAIMNSSSNPPLPSTNFQGSEETIALSKAPTPEISTTSEPYQPSLGPEIQILNRVSDEGSIKESPTQVIENELNPLTIPAEVPDIKIVATSRSWVEVKDAKGNVIVSKTFLPQEDYSIPKENDFILTTGNIGGLKFIVQGQELPPLGKIGVPKRNIVLKCDSLKNFNIISATPVPALEKTVQKSLQEPQSLPSEETISDVMPSVISANWRPSEHHTPLSSE